MRAAATLWSLPLALLLAPGCAPGVLALDDDDATAGDDDATGDDDSGPADDDSTPADDDTAPPGEPWCAPAGGGAVHALVPPEGEPPGPSQAGLGIDLALDASGYRTDRAPVFTLGLHNAGGTPLEATWDNCGYPRFSLVDPTTGTVAWTGSEDDEVDCDGPGTLDLGPGESQVFTLPSSPLPPGTYEARGTAALAFAGPGADPGGPSAPPPFPYEVAVPIQVSEDGGACPDVYARSTFANGISVSAAAEEPVAHPGQDVRLRVEGLGAPWEVGGEWLNCGLPEYAVLDAAGADLWRWSDAEAMDCWSAQGWPAGEVRTDGGQIPPSEVWEALGGRGVEGVFYDQGGDGPAVPYRVRVALQVNDWPPD
ncbi:hypothetical protein L6R50_24555 [Myxococcota bacterium]|nr:hypothetical protein [Myxococcota bacterium]